MRDKITLVTGLWNLGRGELEEFGRSIEHYQKCFDELLGLDVNMVIYVADDDDSIYDQVDLARLSVKAETEIRHRSPYDFPFYTEVQKIRRHPDWYKQADWLEKSPQAKLSDYNPIVMSKMFMLNDVAVTNPFGSKYFFWIDGGLTNTVSPDLIKNVKRIPSYMAEGQREFVFLGFPYQNDTEVHGFKTRAFNEYCGYHAEYVCRGGFFGGTKEAISELNGHYYSILEQTLKDGYMGTEENIHTILSYRFGDKISVFRLADDGLVYLFFDHLTAYPYTENSLVTLIPYDKKKESWDIRTTLYILTFNSPKQLEALFESITDYDNGTFLVNFSRTIVVDNSTDFSTYKEYQELAEVYGFEHIKKADNLGICGGRQFVAEHFMESDSEYYMFLEDDMLFAARDDDEDKLGFGRHVVDMYRKSLTLMHRNRYDFLKMSFSEFYGDNSKQWAWHNVPADVKKKYFDGIETIPDILPTGRRRNKDLVAREGPYYYCNWPAWISRAGNQKIFLDIKWAHPHEQTWMSHVFQQQMAGKINSAVLELSPISHNRFDHYEAEERKES